MRNDKGRMRGAKKRPTKELSAPKTTLRPLMAMEHFMRRNAKSAFKGGGKIGGVAVAAGVSGLLHAITFA
tara:strand:+ start:1003 stop:1212 length:210 start_codon:yes stop_codon:yes gene_type:complete